MIEKHPTVGLNVINLIKCYAKSSVWILFNSPFIYYHAGFQLHCGSEGGTAQPPIRQNRAGYDQTV